MLMISARLLVLSTSVLASSCTHQVVQSTPRAGTPFYLSAQFVDANAKRLGYDAQTLSGAYPVMRSMYISDHRSYPVSTVEYIMEVSAEGYAGEGHAVVTLYRLDADGRHVDASVGLYSNNASGAFESSFVIQREFAESGMCFEGPCEIDATPSDARVAAYREGWTGWFGSVPEALTTRIIDDPANATYVRLDPDAYAIRLFEIQRRYAGKPHALTSSYATDAFQRDWRELANLVCFDMHPEQCRGADERDGSLWPQRHLAMMFVADHRRQPFFELGGLTKLATARTPRALEVTEADVVDGAKGRPGYTGKAFVCFGDGELEWGALGTAERVGAYEGELRNGRPHGEGTLFFTSSCDRARKQPLEERRLHGQFVEGFAEGPAEMYNSIGRLIVAGTLTHGVLSGTARHFSEYGGERSTAEYVGGALGDGAVLYADLDHYFTVMLPLPARRVFTGVRTNGVLTGTWTPVLMAVGAPDHQVSMLGDVLFMDWEATPGAYATGKVVRDYEHRTYRFRGTGEFHWPNGGILEGPWNADGSLIVGKSRYFDPSKKKWYPTTVDANGRFQWTVVKRTRRPWYENIGPELKRWADTAADQATRIGHGFEHFMCRATGTREGKNCQVNVGVDYGPAGPVLTDGNGKPSEVVWETKGIDWEAALRWQQTTDMTDLERRMMLEPVSPFFSVLDTSLLSRAPAVSSLAPVPFVRGAPTTDGEERDCSYGCGHFGARRRDTGTDANGNPIAVYRVHNGTDYLAKPGEPILSPFDGVVTVARSSDTQVIRNFIQIRSATGARVEITYAKPLLGPMEIKTGSRVTRGSLLGFASDLSGAYPGVPNHVHVQYWVPGPKGSSGYWTSPDGLTRIGVKP